MQLLKKLLNKERKPMKISSELLDAIRSINNAAIITHIRPDADALGSACSMKLVLEKLGKTADIYCDSEIPSNYGFIKYTNKIKGTERKMQKCLFHKIRNKHFNAFVFCFNSFAFFIANYTTSTII